MATSLPSLVFEYGDERPTTLYGVCDGAYRPCEIDLLLTKRNWVTARGWVLAWDTETSATFLWDPQDPKSGQIVLPSLPQAPPVGSDCVLSGDPAGTDGYTVVIVEPYGSTVLWYCHVGSVDVKWVKYEYDLGGSWVELQGKRDWVKRHICDLVSHSGKLYYSILTNKYGVLEFSPEPTLRTVKTKGIKFPPNGEESAHADAFLLDLDGKLHMVWIIFANLDGNKIADVAVYKMGFGGSRCVRVNNIGDRAILASTGNNPAGWCSASKFGLRRNTVYWTSPFDKCLHVYNIRTNRKKVQECEGAVELSGVPFWLIPVDRP